MTILLVACLGFALLNWIAVAIDHRRLEYVAKPATLLFLPSGLAPDCQAPSQRSACGF